MKTISYTLFKISLDTIYMTSMCKILIGVVVLIVDKNSILLTINTCSGGGTKWEDIFWGFIIQIYQPQHPRYKVQCLAHLHMWMISHSCTSKICKYKDIIILNPYMQGAKCNILHIYACARFFILSYQMIHSCISKKCKYEVILFFTPYIQGANCNILHICACKIFHSYTSTSPRVLGSCDQFSTPFTNFNL